MKVYWQFKNGSLAQVKLSRDWEALPNDFYEAWDRSLGGWVIYDR